MKVYEAVERQPTTIPITDVLGPDGRIEILAEVKAKGLFEIDYRSDQLVVVAGKYIGQIPLSEQVIIDVRPKFSISRLLQILEKSDEPLKCIEFFRRGYAYSEDSSSTIFEALVKALLVALRPVILEGILKIYQQKFTSSSAPRGRIDLRTTCNRHIFKGEYHKAHFSYYDLSADHCLNRLIAFALWFVGEHLAKFGRRSIVLRREVSAMADYFEGILIDHSRQFLNEARDLLATNGVPALRHYYLQACDIALAIIGRNSVNIIGHGDDLLLSSFLLDMETIFEQYVRNVLRDHSSFRERSLVVLDGNTNGKGWLLADSKKFEAKPDVIVRNREGCRIILDAKYKPKPKEDDRYQILAHAMSFGASKAILVGPSVEGWGAGLTRLGRIGSSTNAIELFTYGIALDNDDLFSEEDLFAHSMLDLC